MKRKRSVIFPCLGLLEICVASWVSVLHFRRFIRRCADSPFQLHSQACLAKVLPLNGHNVAPVVLLSSGRRRSSCAATTLTLQWSYTQMPAETALGQPLHNDMKANPRSTLWPMRVQLSQKRRSNTRQLKSSLPSSGLWASSVLTFLEDCSPL